MKKLKERIKEIENIELLKDNEDGTKQYIITTSSDIDLRKKLFEVLPKEEIVIFELKKTENTLEDAFIKLIDTTKQETLDGEGTMQHKPNKENKTRTEKKNKESKEKKQGKKEEKK